MSILSNDAEANKRSRAVPRHQHADGATGKGQHQRFDQQLTHQAAPAGTDGGAHGHLVLPVLRVDARGVEADPGTRARVQPHDRGASGDAVDLG